MIKLNSFSCHKLSYGLILFNISAIFPGGITIFSTILFLTNSPVASAALWNALLKEDFRASTPVLLAVSNNCFQHFLDIFLVIGKTLMVLGGFNSRLSPSINIYFLDNVCTNDLFLIFFLSDFSFTNIYNSQDSRGSGRVAIF